MDFAVELRDKTVEQLRQEVVEYRRRIDGIMNSPKLGSIIIGRDGCVLFVNHCFCDWTGYEADEVFGKDFTQLFTPETKTQTKNIMDMIFNGYVKFLEVSRGELLSKSGHKICVCWNNSVLCNHEGKVVGLCSIGTLVPEEEKTPDPPEELHNPLYARRRPSIQYVAGDHTYESIGDYLVIQKLGGENSNVMLGMHKVTTEKVAIKSMPKATMSEGEMDRARREIAIMKKMASINSPHIVKIKESFESEDYFTIIMEYVRGGELFSVILKHTDVTEQKAHCWFKQILSAVQTCHDNKIVHRDLKLQNILLDEKGLVKLIDFGLSNYVENGVFRNTFCGTPAYAPPEILLGNQYEGPEVDVWSLGVVLFSMLTAKFPFLTVKEILAGTFDIPDNVSPDCADLLRAMLCVDIRKRISLEHILRHPWIQQDPQKPTLRTAKRPRPASPQEMC